MTVRGQDVPQANSLERVREVVGVVGSARVPGLEAVQKATGLSARHASYYLNAAATLGLIKEVAGRWVLGDLGHELLATPKASDAESAVLRRAAELSSVLQAVAPDLLRTPRPSLEKLARRIREGSGLADATSRRRAQTLLAWRDSLVTPRQVQLELAAEHGVRVQPTAVEPWHKPAAQRAVVTGIALRGFKGFLRADLGVGDFTVVVGTNASGKSNLRDAFRFLHGLARGYSLSEIIGEKWVEGGVLQWKGLRGGIKEACYSGLDAFALEARLRVRDGDRERDARYCIQVRVPSDGKGPRVLQERLVVSGRGQYVFDSHPEKNPPTQEDPLHLAVRLKKEGQKGYQGRVVNVISNRPAISQLLEHKDVKPREVRDLVELALSAFQSMRFLDLSPEAMRKPSLPGQVVLGDLGENLSSVLQAICDDPQRKRALAAWLSELTPLDVIDFEFVPDQTGRVLVTLVEEGGRRTSAYSASDGTLRFLAMIAAFLGPDSAHLYFFEELETGLHPTRLHLLLSLIEQRTRGGACRVVATTHSPQLLTFLSREAVEKATLAYRLREAADQRLVRIVELPRASMVLAGNDVAKLHSAGWLEDAAEFSLGSGSEDRKVPAQ